MIALPVVIAIVHLIKMINEGTYEWHSQIQKNNPTGNRPIYNPTDRSGTINWQD